MLANLVALKKDPDPAPGSQERRAQNNVALAMAAVSLAAAVEQQPQYVAAAKKYVLAAIDYEPWGYTFDKPNIDLAAGHLLYSIGWAYDLLYDQFTPAERARIRTSLERHAGLLYDAFAPKPGKTFAFTQNHNFIPTAGLAVTALALMGESADAPKWAALARAHHHRAGQLLSPDGNFYEGMEYRIFSATWLVRFLDAWEHCTGENLWDRGQFKNWKYYVAHVMLPDGQTVFDFGDIWQGPLTRAKQGDDYAREYPTGTLKSNYNVLYRVAARFKDPETKAVAERMKGFGHTNQEEWWTLIWRDDALKPAAISAHPARVPLRGLWLRVLQDRLGHRRHGVRVQGRPARRAPCHAVAGEGARVAAEQRARAPRQRQLHHLGEGPLPHGRHRLRGPAPGTSPQHRRHRRRRPGRRGRTRRVAEGQPGVARRHPHHVGAVRARAARRSKPTSQARTARPPGRRGCTAPSRSRRRARSPSPTRSS